MENLPGFSSNGTNFLNFSHVAKFGIEVARFDYSNLMGFFLPLDNSPWRLCDGSDEECVLMGVKSTTCHQGHHLLYKQPEGRGIIHEVKGLMLSAIEGTCMIAVQDVCLEL